MVATVHAGGFDVTIFPGPAPGDVLRRYTARTGRMQRPPLWALGHHQSRWGYRSARDVRRVAREARRAPDPHRRDPPRHRPHGRLPRLHLAPAALPRSARPVARAARGGLPRRHDRRPRREGGPALGRASRRCRERRLPASPRRIAVLAEGVAQGCVAAGLRSPRSARVVGRAARAVGRRRRRGHLERHERARRLEARSARRPADRAAAGTGSRRRRGERPRRSEAPRAARVGAQRLRTARMPRDARSARTPRPRSGAPSCCRARGTRASSATPRSGPATRTSTLAAARALGADAARALGLGRAVLRRRHRRLRRLVHARNSSRAGCRSARSIRSRAPTRCG